MGGRSSNSSIGWRPTPGQSKFETEIRNSDIEQGAYFDSRGNLLLEGRGNRDEITYDSIDMNRNVEQRVWDGEQVDYVHNHPDNTIFSPEDIESFEMLENRSMRAVLPNGTSYTLIRNQPRTDNTITIDLKTGESKRGFEPKKIADSYDKAYMKSYNEARVEVHRQVMNHGNISYRQQEDMIYSKVTADMEKWLKSNARRYGYIFRKG